MNYQCNILNYEYNYERIYRYCGDIWRLNDEDCPAFMDEEG